MTDQKLGPKAILESLLGKDKSDAVRDAVKEATKTLDGAGVARKEGDPEATPTSGDAILSALESSGAGAQAATVKAILDAMEKAGAMEAVDKATGSREATIAMLLQAVAGPAPDAPAEEVPADAAYVGEVMKSMKEYIASTTKDMGAIAQGQVDLATAVKVLVDQNKQLSEDNKKQADRLEAVEKQLSGRPRQASAAAETEVQDKSVTEAVRKGIEGESVVLGVKVPKAYADQVNGRSGSK